MPSLPEKNVQPYPLVDVLRAVAALLVVGYHVIAITPWDPRLTEGLLRIFHMGWIGVDCFFVISGFVITLSALKESERDPANFRRGFAIRRLARIAPLYYLTSIVFVLFISRDLLSTPAGHQAYQAIMHLLFVHNLDAATAGAINGPSWSIGLEMQFYLFIMLAVPWLSRVSIWRMVVILVLVAWAYRYAVTWFLVPGVASAHYQQAYTAQLPGTLDAFGLGMAFGLAVVRGKGWLQRSLQPTWLNFSLWTALAFVLSVVLWKIFWPRSHYWYSISMIVFWRGLLALAFACWLASAMTMPWAYSRVFIPLRYLGTISYGIYLWHLPVLLTLMKFPGMGHGAMMGGTIAGAILMGSISWHLMEQPILRRARKWASSRKPPPALADEARAGT
jgi:peptidoglycan/LPS O-acetylase OafA/YrhL